MFIVQWSVLFLKFQEYWFTVSNCNLRFFVCDETKYEVNYSEFSCNKNKLFYEAYTWWWCIEQFTIRNKKMWKRKIIWNTESWFTSIILSEKNISISHFV